MLPQRTTSNRTVSQNPFRKGVCFAHNDSVCISMYKYVCRYKHECAHSARAHPGAKCYKKKTQFQASKKPFPKGSKSGEAVKTNAVARGTPRSSESRSFN